MLRGTLLDPFGITFERRMERTLIEQYEAHVRELLPCVTAELKVEQLSILQDLLALPLSMRGFGHVKLRNVEVARHRQAWLLHRLMPERHARPEVSPSTGHLHGIAVLKAP